MRDSTKVDSVCKLNFPKQRIRFFLWKQRFSPAKAHPRPKTSSKLSLPKEIYHGAWNSDISKEITEINYWQLSSPIYTLLLKNSYKLFGFVGCLYCRACFRKNLSVHKKFKILSTNFEKSCTSRKKVVARWARFETCAPISSSDDFFAYPLDKFGWPFFCLPTIIRY